MVRATAIDLISDTPENGGVFDSRTETQRRVLATVESVGMKESYEARAFGLNPEIKFCLALGLEYQGEKHLVYNSVRYRVIRTYLKGDGLELICERDVEYVQPTVSGSQG